MISGSMLPLFSGAKNAYASQMALFGLNKPVASASGDGMSLTSQALLERIGNSQMLTKSDKSGLSRLMATVEQFGKGDTDGLYAKISAIAGMMEMLNNQKGTTIEPFNAADAMNAYLKAASPADSAVQVAPSIEIGSMLQRLQEQLATLQSS